MRSCPQPIIAAVEGVCAGAGAILAMASDIRFAQPGTKTAFLFARVGLSGADMGACAMLPRLIGQGRAAELLFTGRDMSSDEGVAWGFYNRVVEDVMAEAYALAEELARGPRIAHALTKRQLDAEATMGLDEALEMEARVQAHCMGTNDFRRAYEAFTNKRKPEFQGD
jgi:enoyl-CoA hydratase/carnithine racemase